MQGKGHEMPEKRNTYLTLHKNFVRTDIECTDRVTGEVRTFNSVTLPKGTVIDGVDVSYYQFSPMFVNESRYRGENYRDIPLLTDREVWLKKSVLDEDGQPVLDERGKPAKDIVRVMPAQIKEALDRNRSEYLQSLSEKARGARGVVVDGAVRDIRQLKALGDTFKVFAAECFLRRFTRLQVTARNDQTVFANAVGVPRQ